MMRRGTYPTQDPIDEGRPWRADVRARTEMNVFEQALEPAVHQPTTGTTARGASRLRSSLHEKGVRAREFPQGPRRARGAVSDGRTSRGEYRRGIDHGLRIVGPQGAVRWRGARFRPGIQRRGGADSAYQSELHREHRVLQSQS